MTEPREPQKGETPEPPFAIVGPGGFVATQSAGESHAVLIAEIDKALEHCARSYAMERSYQCPNCAMLRRCLTALKGE